MATGIGIKEESAAAGAAELSKMLADEFSSYTKTCNSHWNVEGAPFIRCINFLKSI